MDNISSIRILLIEDDENISQFITTILEENHYRVNTASTGYAGMILMHANCPDLVLLDLGLPDMDGNEIITALRDWSDIPLIVISARNSETDKVKALDLGADDYMTKPFTAGELQARIRTSLRHSFRHHINASKHCYRFEDLVIDYDKRQILLDDQEIHLTQIEYRLLALLSEHCGRVLTYSFMLEEIWGPYMGSNNRILRVNMANIRRKIEGNPAQPIYIFTEIGIGYRMPEGEYN